MAEIVDDTEPITILISPEGYEDFLTYTEIDEPTEDNIFVTANQVTYTDANRIFLESVYKDYGADYFGDFLHQVTHLCSYRQSIWGSIHGIWGLSNGALSLQDIINAGNGLSLFWWDDNTLRLSQYGPLIGVASVPLSLNTEYYLTISRTGTTVVCEIYDLPERTPASLVDTLSLTGVSLRTYSTILTYHSYNNPSSSATSSGYDKDLIFL